MLTKTPTYDLYDRLRSTLKNSSYSLTESRRIVFEGLSQGSISHARLADTLAERVDRATVYRTLDLFEQIGVVNRIWHGKKNQVELSEIFLPHHHHAVCQRCGKAIDITSQDLELLLAHITKQNDFLAVEHSVEISGYCVRCH